MKLILGAVFLCLYLSSTAQIKPFTAKLKDLAVYKAVPSDEADSDGYLEIGDSVQIIDVTRDGYYKVKFRDKIAFMNAIVFVRDSNLIKAEKVMSRVNALNYAKEEAARKSRLIKKYGVKNGTAIFLHEINLGMPPSMVRASWGEPSDINRSVGKWGVHEQWVYSGSYLYFENGRLTSWQD